MLGPRYNAKRPFDVKIVTKMYPTYMENFARCNETLRELYWEALRAPSYNYLWRRSPYRREKLIKKHFGRTKEERVANTKKINKEYADHINAVKTKMQDDIIKGKENNESLRRKRQDYAR